MKTNNNDPMTEATTKLARIWQERANELLQDDEKKIQLQMSNLLNAPEDKITLIKMIDQSFRPKSTKRIADQLAHILKKNGIPKFFSFKEQQLIKAFLSLGKYTHLISVPKIIAEMRKQSARSIIAGEKEKLSSHLQGRKNHDVRININHLGEAVLGEKEARRRIDSYIADLKNPEIECISIKISTIYSQISSLAFEKTIDVLVKRLSEIYHAAQNNYFISKNGTHVQKSVNLDMEEYKDLSITKQAFIRTLDKEEFKNYQAGIVLQAYLPDSFAIQKELTGWAKKRVENHGAPIKIRIVKGANMEMEILESGLYNWPLAPYNNKLEVDANYKRMVDYGMEEENIKAVNLGIASHNLFELAYAYNIAKTNNVIPYFVFEMLEGMADHIRRAIKETVPDMLLYAPIARKQEFINAIAYLVRRLDENTGHENFLRYSCNITTNSKQWDYLEKQFIDSYFFKDKAKQSPNRIQDRTDESFKEKGTFYEDRFTNEADTDFSLIANVDWAKQVRDKWKKSEESEVIKVPVVVGGSEITEGRDVNQCFDLSLINENNNSKIHIADSFLANEDDIDTAIQTALNDDDNWKDKPPLERHKILSHAANNLRKARGDLIGAAIASTGKIFSEADAEVSEAIDFAEFYPFSVRKIEDYKNLKTKGKGTGLVITPWNFPVAIPCGGISAALAGGNTVIFKPASNATLAAWILCNSFWNAGVSKKTLQFFPCRGSDIGTRLIRRQEIDFIILTGGTDTGLNILEQRPNAFLSAETGGKNAIIVTAMSDRDQAVKNIIHSAFSNCGQKCSAASLLILEEEVYEDENFKTQLVDAAQSYKTGSAWEYDSKMGPMTNIPGRELKRAFTELDSGETWALKPKNINHNPYLWTPGIKYGVKIGSYSHMTEFFGPVLSVIKARNLKHAINIVNETGYGLTSGIESLDIREQKYWKNRIKAGNLYINRGTTGAIVLRQPFGGMGKSAIGAGIKAGGLNYTSQFMEIEETGKPSNRVIKKQSYLLRCAQEWQTKLDWNQFSEQIKEQIKKSVDAIKSYIFNAEQEFYQEKDYFNLRGQDNICRYVPLKNIVVRISEKETLFEIIAMIAGAQTAASNLQISIPKDLKNLNIDFIKGNDCKNLIKNAIFIYETDTQLAKRIPSIDRIRYADKDRVPQEILTKAAANGFYIARNKVKQEGRLELLNYFIEQSICDNYHRYGNLIDRTLL